MNNITLRNGMRFVMYVLFQALVLKNVQISGFMNYTFSIIIYPICLLLLPIKMQQIFVILYAFFLGFAVDLFYDTPGVHAGACLWTAVARPMVLRFLEPQNGYNISWSPTSSNLGIVWFVQYTGFLMLIFFISYFILDIFTFVYFGQIFVKAIVSFIISLTILILLQILFNPKY